MQTITRLQVFSSKLERWNLKPASRLIEGAIRVIYSAILPSEAQIHHSVHFEHSGLGVVLNRLSIVEENCRIGVHVVLGWRAPTKGAPHLEQGVIVHAGAKIIGPVRIGKNSVIAANAVVLTDIPENVMAAGVPATIKKTEINILSYTGTTKDAEAKDVK